MDNKTVLKLVAMWLLLPIMSVWALVDGGSSLGPAWRAHAGEGIKGRYVATTCIKGDCRFRGRWVSADGLLTLEPVRVRDVRAGLREGDPVVAVDVGQDGVVYAPGGNSYLWAVIALVLGLCGFLTWLLIIRNHFRNRDRIR